MQINSRDLISGALLASLGILYVSVAGNYDIGSLRDIRPGSLPLVLGCLAIAFGLVLMGSGLLTGAGEPLRVEWRPLLAISLGIAAFAFLAGRMGYLPAVMAAVIVSAAAEPRRAVFPTLLLAIAVSSFTWAIFIFGLGVPIASFKWDW